MISKDTVGRVGTSEGEGGTNNCTYIILTWEQ